MKQYFSEPIVRAAAVLAFGPILAALIGGYFFYQARAANDVITVTGSARETVTSDHVRWTISVAARTGISDQASGFAVVTRGVGAVTKRLTEAGIVDIQPGTPSIYEQYAEGGVITGYNVSQDLVVQSDDVKKIQELSQDAAALQGAGYLVRTGYVEYTYSKLDEIRVRLLGAAIADAEARANSITDMSERSTGALKSASSGVVQVLAKNGVDISDYGSYDTQSIEKDVMVTVRAVFGIQ